MDDNATEISRSRGLALTLWLGFMILVNLYTAFTYYRIIDDFVRHSDPVFTGTLLWALPTFLVLALVNGVAAVILFVWRKIGFYIFIVSSAIALILNLVVGTPLGAALLGLVGIGILWLLLRSRWHYFR